MSWSPNPSPKNLSYSIFNPNPSLGEFGNEFGSDYNASYFSQYYQYSYQNYADYADYNHEDTENWEKNFKLNLLSPYFFIKIKGATNRSGRGHPYRFDFNRRNHRPRTDFIHHVLSPFPKNLDEKYDAAQFDIRP